MWKFKFDSKLAGLVSLDADETRELMVFALQQRGSCSVVKADDNITVLKGEFDDFPKGPDESTNHKYTLWVDFEIGSNTTNFYVRGRISPNASYYWCLVFVLTVPFVAGAYGGAIIAALLVPVWLWYYLSERRRVKPAIRKVFSDDPKWGLASIFRAYNFHETFRERREVLSRSPE